jgi:hypothetical protein
MTTPFPATLVLHTPKGEQPYCDKHAAEVRGAMSLLGGQVLTVTAPFDSECADCRAEAREVA